MGEIGSKAVIKRSDEYLSTSKRARDDMESLASWTLEKIRKVSDIAGADFMYSTGRSVSLSLRDGEPEENTSGSSGAVGIRVIAHDGRQGTAASNSVDRMAIEELISWACANCRSAEKDTEVILYDGEMDDDQTSLDMFDDRIANGASAEERHAVCMEMTSVARARDKRVVSVRAASWSEGVGEHFYASSTGVSGWRCGTSVSCGVVVAIGDGEKYELGSYGKSKRYISDIESVRYAELAVDKTIRVLGGKPVATGKYSLILEPEIASSIIDEIGDLFCASDVHKGRSLMKGMIGKCVASACLTLTDDARLPRISGSDVFDGEGVPTGKTVLIKDGIAENYLYNLQYAARDGVKSTGNAYRSLGGIPDIAPSNLVVSPGSKNKKEILSSVDNGILVTELMGLHTLNPVSGEFSLGAKGVRVVKGEMCEPVSGVTIAGNLIDLLKHISAIGSDLEFFGSVGAPTMLVEGIAVAGV